MPGPLSATCRIRRPGAVLSEQRTTPPARRVADRVGEQVADDRDDLLLVGDGRQPGRHADAQVEVALGGDAAQSPPRTCARSRRRRRWRLRAGARRSPGARRASGPAHGAASCRRWRGCARRRRRPRAARRPASSRRVQRASMIDSGDFSSWPRSASCWRRSSSEAEVVSAIASSATLCARLRHQRDDVRRRRSSSCAVVAVRLHVSFDPHVLLNPRSVRRRVLRKLAQPLNRQSWMGNGGTSCPTCRRRPPSPGRMQVTLTVLGATVGFATHGPPAGEP